MAWCYRIQTFHSTVPTHRVTIRIVQWMFKAARAFSDTCCNIIASAQTLVYVTKYNMFWLDEIVCCAMALPTWKKTMEMGALLDMY